MEPNQGCKAKQFKLSCFCTAADCNSSFHWSRQWLKFRSPTTKMYSSCSMGKTTSLFYGYQKQGYKSGGSDVAFEELNHRITKKCMDFSWLKEESWGRESLQTSSCLQTSLPICVSNSTTVIYGTSIIHFSSILDSQLLVSTCSHNRIWNTLFSELRETSIHKDDEQRCPVITTENWIGKKRIKIFFSTLN